MKRRRKVFERSERAKWEQEREAQMRVYIARGLGIRPADWWRFESDRPELAEGAGWADMYVHLTASLNPDDFADPSEPRFGRARERFRYLLKSGELTDAEEAQIQRGATAERGGELWRWRLALLRDSDDDETTGPPVPLSAKGKRRD